MSDPLYVITAQVVVRFDDGGTSSRQVPTFLLDPDVQGIVHADHAARVGMSVLTTMLPPGQHGIESIHVLARGARGHARLTKTFDRAEPGANAQPPLSRDVTRDMSLTPGGGQHGHV